MSGDERLFKPAGSKVWYGWFYENGKQITRSTRCTDKRAAAAVRTGWERAAADPTYRASHEATLGLAIKQVVADREERRKSDGTVRMLKSKGGHIARVLGVDTPLARIDAAAIDCYVSERRAEGAVDATIYKEWSTLLGALKIAKRRGQFPGDIEALRPIGLSGKSTPKERFLTRPEFDKLIADLMDDDLTQRRHSMKGRAAHIMFIVATGARWSESVRAKREDIDTRTGSVRLRGTKTEGSARSVPYSSLPFGAELMDRLLEHCPDKGKLFRPWTSMAGDLIRACERVKIEPVSPNDLRRTCATWLRQAGIEPHLIAAVLGHADSRMVERTYGRMPLDSLAKALQQRTEPGGKVIPFRKKAGSSG